MPARAPAVDPPAAAALAGLGARIRARRKALRVSATAAAEAAGLSRVTLHRIERGEPSVAMGAYLSVIATVGLELELVDPSMRGVQAAAPPAKVRLADFPQLRRLAGQRGAGDEIAAAEAIELYERNWRHVDQSALETRERELVRTLGGGRLLV